MRAVTRARWRPTSSTLSTSSRSGAGARTLTRTGRVPSTFDFRKWKTSPTGTRSGRNANWEVRSTAGAAGAAREATARSRDGTMPLLSRRGRSCNAATALAGAPGGVEGSRRHDRFPPPARAPRRRTRALRLHRGSGARRRLLRGPLRTARGRDRADRRPVPPPVRLRGNDVDAADLRRGLRGAARVRLDARQPVGPAHDRSLRVARAARGSSRHGLRRAAHRSRRAPRRGATGSTPTPRRPRPAPRARSPPISAAAASARRSRTWRSTSGRTTSPRRSAPAGSRAPPSTPTCPASGRSASTCPARRSGPTTPRTRAAKCLSTCLSLLSAPYHLPDGRLNDCLLCDEVAERARLQGGGRTDPAELGTPERPLPPVQRGAAARAPLLSGRPRVVDDGHHAGDVLEIRPGPRRGSSGSGACR